MNVQEFEMTTLDLKKISSEGLIQRLKKLVQTERKITQSILECLNEIELRKFHLERGYSSLFDFLTLDLGYSAASAQRRIDGARLLRQIPEIGEKLENGQLNLSQVSLLQKSIRSYQTETKNKVTIEQKKILLEKIEKHTAKKSELILAKELNLPLPTYHEKMQIHKDESQTVSLCFSKEEMLEIEQVRNLKSHALGSLDYKSLILYLARRELKKYQTIEKSQPVPTPMPMPAPAPAPGERASAFLIKASTSEAEVVGARSMGGKVSDNKKVISKAISKPVYRKVLKPSSCCEFKDPKTQRVCGSRVFLQVDHIKPRWSFAFEQDKAVMNELQNLRVLCANHNKFRYLQGIG